MSPNRRRCRLLNRKAIKACQVPHSRETSEQGPPGGGRNYLEQDPQATESPDITARSLGDITGPESPDCHSACWPPLPFLCEPMLLETSASPHGCQGQGAASRSCVPPADACWSSYAATVTCRGGRLGSLLLEHVLCYRRSCTGLAPFSPPACADVP